MASTTTRPTELAVQIPIEGAALQGDLVLPDPAVGLVLFAHGSGSSRHSPRNRYVAGVLQDAGIATLLMDLLTRQEEIAEQFTRHLRFDIDLLAGRLGAATDWVGRQSDLPALGIGYFGASTGAAAALVAAAQRPDLIRAIVSRGGRPDLAEAILPRVQAPTLLLVGGYDHPVIAMNQQAYDRMTCEKRLEIIPGATHLFEEPGTLEQVAKLAAEWLVEHLR